LPAPIVSMNTTYRMTSLWNCTCAASCLHCASSIYMAGTTTRDIFHSIFSISYTIVWLGGRSIIVDRPGKGSVQNRSIHSKITTMNSLLSMPAICSPRYQQTETLQFTQCRGWLQEYQWHRRYYPQVQAHSSLGRSSTVRNH
jgi:hypothetical protein